MAMKWYVVHTYSGFEHKVKADIELQKKLQPKSISERIGEVIVPVEPSPTTTGEKPKRAQRKKLFPGYIIIQADLTDEVHNFIRHRPNVTGFLRNESGPQCLSEAEVKAIKNQMDHGPTRAVPEVQFEEGISVRIKSGPFVNFTGMIEEVKPEKKKLRVLVTIFGRATPVELDYNQVEKV